MSLENRNPLFPHLQILISNETGIPCIYNTKTKRIVSSAISKKNYRWVNVQDINDKKYTVSLGRMLLMLTQPMEDYSDLQCDHIDRNSLNDRIENLRWVTPSQNSMNRTYPKHVNKHRKMLLLFDNQEVRIVDTAKNFDLNMNPKTLYILACGKQGTHYSRKYKCTVYWIDDEQIKEIYFEDDETNSENNI